MTHRKTPCDVCENVNIDVIKEIIPTPTGKDASYEERCNNCDNLLYGIITKIK